MSGDRNARMAWTLAAAVGGMLALAYAASPLYEAFCKATGFAGTPLVAQESDRPILKRTVAVRFDTNTDSNLPWRFEPVQREVKIRLGEEKLVFFRATNVSQRPIVGTRDLQRHARKSRGVVQQAAMLLLHRADAEAGPVGRHARAVLRRSGNGQGPALR